MRLRVETEGYGGQHVKKEITVVTNSETSPELKLYINGYVESFVTITPRKAQLKGGAGEDIQKELRIVPNEKYPFEIKEVVAEKGEHIRWELDKMDPSGYRLTVYNRMEAPGHYFDALLLKTDSETRPELKIWVFGSIKKK